MSRRAWLEARRQGIGGSDAAVLFGQNPYSSLTKLWGEKTGRVAPTEDNIRLRWGRRLEFAILDEFAHKTGLQVADQADALPERMHEFEVEIDDEAHTVPMLRHAGLPIMIGNTDGIVLGAPAGSGVVDGKTVERYTFSQWLNDGHPPWYMLVQLQHYLAIAGLRWGCIAAFTGLSDPLYVYEVEADAGFTERLMDAEDTFWRRYVVRDQQPPPDRSKATADALREIYPVDSGRVVDLTGPAVDWAARYDELGDQIRELKDERDGLGTLLKATIADASIARLPDGSGYTYAAGKRGRTLRRSSAKAIQRKTKT